MNSNPLFARKLVRRVLVLTAVIAIALGSAALAQEGEVVEVHMITDGPVFHFDPVGLVIEPGTTIRFVNVSGMHSADAYAPANGKPQRIPDGAESWDSGVLVEEGATFEVTLSVEGVYDFYCLPHEALGMVGRIIVGDPAAYPAQPTDGLFPMAADALPPVDAILAEDDGVLTYEEFHAE